LGNAQSGIKLTIYRHQRPFSPHHQRHVARRRNIASTVNLKVFEDDKFFLGGLNFWNFIQLTPDDEQTRQATKQLLGHMAVMVGMVPECPCRMIRWDGELVSELFARNYAEEHIIARALGGDV
jgi:hypothetical protein